VNSLTDTTLPANSPYVIKVKAALTSFPTTYIEDFLSLTIKNTCSGSLTSPI